jgi:hypothetical protein
MFGVHVFAACWELSVMSIVMSTTTFASHHSNSRHSNSRSVRPARSAPILRSSAHRAAPAARPSAAVYRRRRAVVGSVTAIIAAVTLVAAHDVLVGSGGVPASAATGQLARSTIIAQPGDTLWSIAGEHRGGVAISTFVDKLVELNGGAAIYAGQEVVLP